MTIFTTIRRLLKRHRRPPSRNVALVLSGGGARGYAHIGAIEVLQERGYNITSVAGTSMGALVGGAFANGKLGEFKVMALGLNRKKIINLMDISMGLDHVANGEKLLAVMGQMIGNVRIEQLPIPFACCASDIVSGRERVFTSGPLQTAIRASISIPCFFKPVRENGHIDVDGSVHNTLPLDRVHRRPGDLLVAVNVNGPDSCPYDAYQKKKQSSDGVFGTIRAKLPFHKVQFSENYMSMALRVTNLTIQANTQLAIRLTPPDICAEIPMDLYGLFDFEKAQELIEVGRQEMTRQLDLYEASEK